MTTAAYTTPTERIRRALNQLLERNERTQGAEAAEFYLGPRIFVARLGWPKVIEGQWEDVDRTADLFDLMDAHQAESKSGKR